MQLSSTHCTAYPTAWLTGISWSFICSFCVVPPRLDIDTCSSSFTMASLPPISDPSLTSNVDSSEGQNQEQPPPLPVTSRSDSERGQSLPGLKEVVGPEYHAKRPLLPHPGPAPRIPTFFIPGVSVLYLDNLPIRTYRIGGASYNMTQPPNETTNQRSRQTVDRRRVTYRLEVVQQPEKARACGSGPRCRYLDLPSGTFTNFIQHLRTADRSIHPQLSNSGYLSMIWTSP